jgi:hypothetical protein
MKSRLHYTITGVFLLAVFLILSCDKRAGAASGSNNSDTVKVGAWYFGGWSFPPDANGHTFHISPTLTTAYMDREPVWGWREDDPGVMEQQIKYAADAGLDFWGFCWYDNTLNPENKELMDNLNNGLELFLKANNSHLLNFFLLSCHPVSPVSWEGVCDRIITYFKAPNYLRVDEKPVIAFFNTDELINGLGGVQKTRAALQLFRDKAKHAGYAEVLIGARTFPRPQNPTYQNTYLTCGFDFLTTYNNADDGRQQAGGNSYESLLEGDRISWNGIADHTPLPFLPVVGTGYDMRPWAQDHPTIPASDFWYTGVTPEKIGKHLSEGIRWVKDHQAKTLGNLLIMYAWNENGEGAWLTPTKMEGAARLAQIKEVIQHEAQTNK